MLIIFMRNYLKGQLAPNRIFVCFGKDYVQMKKLAQSDRFERSVSERQKDFCVI